MTSLYEISYYGIEYYITLTLPVYPAYYMTLFNTNALHVGRWCSGMTLAWHGEGPGFNTHTLRCSVGYFLLFTVFCTFCSLFPIFGKSTRKRCLFLFFRLTIVYQGFYI